MMDRRRSLIVFLLTLVLLLSAATVGKRFALFEENSQMIRGFEDRILLYLMKELVFEHHLPRNNDGYRSDTSSVAGRKA